MKKKIFPFVYILVFILIAFVIFLFLKKVPVSQISCTSQFGPCSQSISGETNRFRGANLVDAFKGLKKTLSSNRKVLRYSVRFRIPDTIDVYIVEKKAEVGIGKQGFDNFIILDKDGYVISVEKNTSLPIINVSDGSNIDFSLGTKIPDNLYFAEELERNIFNSYAVKLSILYRDRIETKLNNGPKVIFPTSGEIDVLMGSLNLILSRLNNANSELRIGEIDLRYKNPIIR